MQVVACFLISENSKLQNTSSPEVLDKRLPSCPKGLLPQIEPRLLLEPLRSWAGRTLVAVFSSLVGSGNSWKRTFLVSGLNAAPAAP